MQCDSSNPYNSDDNRSQEKQSHQRKTPHRWEMNTSFFRIYHQFKSPAKSRLFNIPSHLPPARKWSIKDVMEIFYLLCSLYNEEPGWPCKDFGKSMHRSFGTNFQKQVTSNWFGKSEHRSSCQEYSTLRSAELARISLRWAPLPFEGFAACLRFPFVFPDFCSKPTNFLKSLSWRKRRSQTETFTFAKKIALQLLRIEMNMIWHVLDGQYSIRKRKDFVWTSFKNFWLEYLLFFVYLIFMIMYPIYGVAYFVH